MTSMNPDFKKITIKLLSRMEQLEQADESGVVINVTSAEPGEGKSFVASALALNAAGTTAKKILLVDANMDSPVLHKTFNLNNESGLAEAIISRDWDSIDFQNGSITNLAFLPVGQECKSGLLFKKHVVREFLAYVKDRFDLIIIDSASIVTSGANSLVSLVDGMVMVIDSSSTRRQVIQYALDEINVDREKIIGSIINKKAHYIPKFIYERL